jgi:hypothetical protein
LCARTGGCSTPRQVRDDIRHVSRHDAGLRPDYSAALAADQVAALFKCGKAQVAPLLGSKPVIVKKG